MGILGKIANKSLGKKLIKTDPTARKVQGVLNKKNTPTSSKAAVGSSVSRPTTKPTVGTPVSPRQQIINSARRRSVVAK